MATFKLTVSDTRGRSLSRELKDAEANQLIGSAIGAQLDAGLIGMAGKITLTGGSDKSGVPMREDVHGGARKYVMISRGVGLPRAPKGQRIRKLIRGGDISEEIFQVNCSYDGVFEEPKAEKEEAGDAPSGGDQKASGDKKPAPETKADAKEAPPAEDSKKASADKKPAPETKADAKEAPSDGGKKQA